jgi:tetratricopeptide (TPR) repeat protein
MSEYDEVKMRYLDGIVRRTKRFQKLPPEEWRKFERLVPQFQAVASELSQRSEAEPLDVRNLCQILVFSTNMTGYLRRRRETRKVEWLEIGLMASQRLADKRREGLFLNELGLYENATGNNLRALEYYELALPLIRLSDDKNNEASVLNNIGLIYKVQGIWPQALEYYNEALAIYRSLAILNLEATTLNNIGSVYLAREEKAEALEYYKQALAIYHSSRKTPVLYTGDISDTLRTCVWL